MLCTRGFESHPRRSKLSTWCDIYPFENYDLQYLIASMCIQYRCNSDCPLIIKKQRRSPDQNNMHNMVISFYGRPALSFCHLGGSSVQYLETPGTHPSKLIVNDLETTRMGFEPTRAEHIGLAVQRLNHSATSSWLISS